jgi:Cu(I)/Ag(I) efflux system membrane fusion protein
MRDLTTAIRASARVAYDPDLYNAILEHQQALAALKNGGSAGGNYQTETKSLIRSSKLRLRQMGLSDEQIEQVSKPGFDASNLLLSKPGGTVWVYIEIYDYEAPLVKAGQMADLTSAAAPGKIYKATVRSVDTVVNSETRTLRARAEAVNVDGSLRPETYLNAVIHAPAGRKLAIPSAAVIDTGTRQLVYVEKGDAGSGEYEPREVTLGKKAEDYYEVLSGVKEGERVVASANFLIDSESKLKAASQGK